MAYLWDKPEAGQTDSSIICLFIHLLSLTAVCFQFTSVLGVDGEKRSEPSVNLTRWLTTCFRVVPQRPWAEVTLRRATLADNEDGQRKKKSDTIVPSWMVCEQMVSPERVSGLPQRAENTLSYFLLLLWHFKLWNLIAKPADGLLNCPSCPPHPLPHSLHPLPFVFIPGKAGSGGWTRCSLTSGSVPADPRCILVVIKIDRHLLFVLLKMYA